MKRIFLALALLSALGSTSIVQPAAFVAGENSKSATVRQQSSLVPINFTNPTTGESFLGWFDVNRFAVQNGQLVAIGTLFGTVTRLVNGVLTPQTITQALTLPVLLPPSGGSCEILTLVLGPLDLNILGLRVQLNQVVLEITAEPGPGNLLGNLLCAIAGLLDAGGPLQGLVGLLNNLLRILG